MARWLVAAVLTLSSGWSTAASAGAYGSMRFSEHAHDFGDVYQGKTLVHRFAFTNAGPGPLTIQGVHAACGCTAVAVDQGRTYQPGESGAVEVTFDTTAFAGSVAKTVTVLSNERLLPDRLLTVKARVKTEIEADPPLVDFGDTTPAERAVRVVRLRPLKNAAFAVQDLSFNANVLTATVARDGADWLVTTQLKDGLAPGFINETITVRTNAVHLKDMPLPVRAQVKGPVDVAPAYLEFGAIAAGAAAKRSVTMRGAASVTGSRAELIVNGKVVDDSTKFIKIDTVPHEKDRQLVAVELKNSANAVGSVHGKLYLGTSDPGQKELTVDFYAFFR